MSVSAMFFWWRREGQEWTGLLPAEDGIKDRTVMYTWGLGTRVRVVGWACAPREAGPALGMRVAAQNLLRVSFRGFERVEREYTLSIKSKRLPSSEDVLLSSSQKGSPHLKHVFR